MKKIYIIIAIIFFASCESKNKRAFIVAKSDDNNWTTSGRVYCDSVDMVTENHAIYWIDGSKFNMRGDVIKVYTTP